jgi:hypothetical protein
MKFNWKAIAITTMMLCSTWHFGHAQWGNCSGNFINKSNNKQSSCSADDGFKLRNIIFPGASLSYKGSYCHDGKNYTIGPDVMFIFSTKDHGFGALFGINASVGHDKVEESNSYDVNFVKINEKRIWERTAGVTVGASYIINDYVMILVPLKFGKYWGDITERTKYASNEPGIPVLGASNSIESSVSGTWGSAGLFVGVSPISFRNKAFLIMPGIELDGHNVIYKIIISANVRRSL